MSKELVTAEQASKELSINTTELWAPQDNTANSIIIPKVMVMQGLSKAVIDGNARFGDFIDSLTNEVLGSVTSPFEFIPFHVEKEIFISENKSNDPSKKNFKFVRKEKLSASNESLPWNDVVGGVEIQRTHVYSFYVLNPKDMTLPYIIQFKGKSLRNGKVLNTTAFIKAAMAKSFPPAYHYILKGVKESNDKGTYVVIHAERGPASTIPEIRSAAEWKQTFMAGIVKEHEVEESDYVAPASQPAPAYQENPEF